MAAIATTPSTSSTPHVDRLNHLLAPLTQAPANDEYPQTDTMPNTNHFGWVSLYQKLLTTEESVTSIALDSSTLAKVQTIFDRYVQSMVAQGFDVNRELAWQDKKPLHAAASRGCVLTLTALIKQGADVNLYGSKDSTYGPTPLYCASQNDQLKAAEILIQNGADVNKPYKLGGQTALPLHTATSPEMCTLLVKNGCSVNAVGTQTFHESALHWAAHCGRPDTIFTLLKLGARDRVPVPDEMSALGVPLSALEVAQRVHDGASRPMMLASQDPLVTGLSVSLLSSQDLVQGIGRLGQILEKEELERKKSKETKQKEHFTFLTTTYQPKTLGEKRDVEFHRIMQAATDGLIAFNRWDRGFLHNGNLANLGDYFDKETGAHIFGKQVRTLAITHTHLPDIVKENCLEMPDGTSYLADLIARNPEIDTIDLSYTQLGDTQVRILLRALDKNTRLRHLILEGNPVSPELLAQCEGKLKKNRM